jgi:F420-dependent oxidoreductase-like protein
MRLGLNLGYWGAGNDSANLALAQEADRLGYDVVWVAEAYGSDAATVLSWIAAQTQRVDVGSAIFQIPGRSPAMTAMTAATLDTLSGGRFRLGIGVSGPQVSEGWHGVRFDAPLGRTREYIEIVRLALSRQRVKYDGKHYTLPLPDGPGKALHLTVHPVREHIPIYLAALGPKNLELCGEISDGWLSIFTSASHLEDSLSVLRAGRARRAEPAAGDESLDGFDVVANCGVVLGDDSQADLEAAANPLRPQAALYIGGMGSRERNFYNEYAQRLGYTAEAKVIQDLYLAKDYDGAMAAVPFGFLDDTALLGSVDRISDRLQEYADAGVTTMTISPAASSQEERLTAIRAVAAAFDKSGVG